MGPGNGGGFYAAQVTYSNRGVPGGQPPQRPQVHRTTHRPRRSCMNNLKHGRYAKRLPEKLTAAGDHGGAALYQKVRGEIGTTFQAQPDDPRQMRQLDQMTAKVWLLARSAGVNGWKP